MSLCCVVYKSKTTSTAILSFKKSFLFGSAFPRLESPVLPWKDENDNEKIAPVPGPRSQGRVVENPGKDQQSDQHHQWGQQNACVWHTWQGYHLEVLSWSSLNISVFWSFTKNLFKARWSLTESFLKQSSCHARHTRFAVVFPLPSCCVSWLFSTIDCRFIYEFYDSINSFFYCACSTEACEKVYLCQGSHWAKSSVVFRCLTKNPDLALFTEMPTHVTTHLMFLCPHWIQSMRSFRFCNKSLYWPGPQNAGAKNFVAVVHSAHISRRTSVHARKKNFWNPADW